MKKMLVLFLCLLLALSFATPAFAADAPKTGTLQMLAYNVSGIPLVGDFQGSVFTTTNDRAKKIGTLLNGTDVDFISVEEDFNGHDHLAAQTESYDLSVIERTAFFGVDGADGVIEPMREGAA
ncbi:MAG: hypothetical protein II621_09915, partial [Clostridia bacterium]|nr:hypothetical protein [Clostridia bacterium]